jgi:hypothetical protein
VKLPRLVDPAGTGKTPFRAGFQSFAAIGSKEARLVLLETP